MRMILGASRLAVRRPQSLFGSSGCGVSLGTLIENQAPCELRVGVVLVPLLVLVEVDVAHLAMSPVVGSTP